MTIPNAFTLGQNRLAGMAQAGFEDYRQRFAPLEAGAIRPVQSYEDTANEAGGRVATAFSTLPGIMQRRRAGFGASAGEGQAASETRRSSLQRAVANADAKTRAIQGIKGQRRIGEDFAFSAYADDMAAARSMARGVAQSEAQREAQYQQQFDQYRQRKAQRRGGILSLAGTLIGFAAGGPAGAKLGGMIGGAAG